MFVDQRKSLIILVLLGVAIFIYHLSSGIIDARRMDPLPSVEFLYWAICLCGVVWWLRAETHSSPVTRIYCAGVFAIVAWPFILAYHLLKTRGVRGLIPLFALIGAFVFARMLALVIYFAVFGFPTVLSDL